MRKKAGQEPKGHLSETPIRFAAWVGIRDQGDVGLTVDPRDGLRITFEAKDGSFHEQSLGDEKTRELHRVLSAYMEPREKARLQAEALAKLSPAERWALGLEEPGWERDERRRGR